MKPDIFLCWEDKAGLRGYLWIHANYSLRQLSATEFLIQGDGVSAIIDDPDNNLFYLNDPYRAMEWVTNGDHKDAAIRRGHEDCS